MDLLEKYKLVPSEVPAFLSEDYSDNLFQSLNSVINPDDLLPSVQDKIDEQTEILEKRAKAQIAELEKHTKELETQTKVHISNYEELHRFYEQQQEKIDKNEKETKNNKIRNAINLLISILSIIIAICAWLFPR